MNRQLVDGLTGTVQARMDALTGYNPTKDWMDKHLEYWKNRSEKVKRGEDIGSYLGKFPESKGTNSISTPSVQPPETSQIKMPNIDVEPKSLATYKFEFGGKQFELQGDSSQQNVIDEFFREMEQAKKRW